jgi:hypothetical protein
VAQTLAMTLTNLKFIVIEEFFALLLKECCSSFFSQFEANHIFMIRKLCNKNIRTLKGIN